MKVEIATEDWTDLTTGTAKERPRVRTGDLFLVALLLANLVCGVGLIGVLRADLSKDLVAAESTLVSSKMVQR